MNAISRLTRLGAVSAGIAAVAATALIPAASASTTGATPDETATNQHCVTDLDTGSTTCFQTWK